MIGMVFVNKTGDVNEVIISALGESGNRIEKLHQPENVVIDGFSNKGSEVIGFISVGVKNSDISYKLNIRNCKVFDDKSFKLIFGNIKTYS